LVVVVAAAVVVFVVVMVVVVGLLTQATTRSHSCLFIQHAISPSDQPTNTNTFCGSTHTDTPTDSLCLSGGLFLQTEKRT
jgi:hypothetical protein